MERELRQRIAGADLRTRPDQRGLLLQPLGAVGKPRVARVAGRDERTVAVDDSRERLFGHARAGKAAVEEVALHAARRLHGVDPQCYAHGAPGQPQPLAATPDEPEPGARIGARAGWVERLL